MPRWLHARLCHAFLVSKVVAIAPAAQKTSKSLAPSNLIADIKLSQVKRWTSLVDLSYLPQRATELFVGHG